MQAFICRTYSIWFSAFSCSVTPFCFASDRMISSMRFRAASSILAQYCLAYTQLFAPVLFLSFLLPAGKAALLFFFPLLARAGLLFKLLRLALQLQRLL